MASTRMRRVNATIREVLAETTAKELSDPRLGFVTFTDVQASTDLKVATVYLTVLEESRRESSLAALEAARGILQARVGAALRSRNTPQLRFTYDDQSEKAARITALIDRESRSGGA